MPAPTARTRAAALLVAGALLIPGVALATAGPAAPAAAAPGSPGVPSPPSVVYDEDFENGPATSPILRLNQYTGASGQTYTADPAWLTGCNGWVSAAVQSTTAGEPIADCGNRRDLWNLVQQTSVALGVLHGQTAAEAVDNHAISALSLQPLDGQTLELATTSGVALPTSSRFLAFGVDVGASNCHLDHPLLQFFLVNEEGEQFPAGSEIDACSSPTTVTVPPLGTSGAQTFTVGQYTTNGAVLFSGNSVGIRMVNDQPSDFGNDHAFDDIRILDATPQLDKEFVGGWAPSGGRARLRFTVTNTSELGSKQGWSFRDALPDGMTVASPSDASTTCPDGVLTATGAEVSLTGELSVGMTSCTAEVDVTAPLGGYTNGPDRVTVTGLNPPASASVTFSRPGLTLAKTAGAPVDVNQDGLVDAGDTIPYSFELHNTGDVPLTGVSIDDPLVPDPACPTVLAAGASGECAGDYTITPADAASGTVVNTATATGTPPAPAPAAVSPPATTTTAVTAAAPGIHLRKSADPPGGLVEGETLTYSFVVDNTGNLPLHDVAISEESFTGSGPLSPVDCPTTDLAVGGELVCTATYTVTHDDLVAGTVDNTATAAGTPAGIGAAPVTSAASTVGLPTPAAPALTATKTASPLVVRAAGDTIAYTVAVVNDGNLIVDGLTVDETRFTGSGPAPVFACALTRLVPGQHTTCSAAYTATQADVDSGSIQNTATVTGVTAGDAPVTSPPTEVTVTADAAAALTVAKSASAATIAAAGQVVRYDFAVRNTGGLTLHGLVVDDVPTAPAGALDSAPTCPETTLPPGRTVTCTATHTVTQEDVDHGTLADTATATASDPAGAGVASAASSLSLPVVAASQLTIDKAADATSIVRAGQAIAYTFTVTNTGATTIAGVSVTDTPVAPAGPLEAAPQCDVTTLAPGAASLCTASYRVTQADIDHGGLGDTATASGTDAHGDPVVSAPDGLVLDSTAVAALTLTPQPAPSGATAGQVVPLTFVATNSGDVTIANVVLVDDRGGSTPCEPDVLAPGESATCRVTPTVTQDEFDAGALTVTATAEGTAATGATVRSLPVTETVAVTGQVASLSLTKSASAPSVVLGGTIAYLFAVRNTGTVTLVGVTVTDTQSAPAGPTESPPVCAATRLAPGATTTCTASYIPTAADLAAGTVTDAAIAHAETTLGEPVSSDPATLTVTVTAPATASAGSGSGQSAVGGLASTGGDLWPPLAAALVLLTAGAAAWRVARRHRA
ncbi:MAG: hypothetical protein AAGC66_05845 [Leifsonia sp.]